MFSPVLLGQGQRHPVEELVHTRVDLRAVVPCEVNSQNDVDVVDEEL